MPPAVPEDVASLGRRLLRAWFLLLLADRPHYGYEVVVALRHQGVMAASSGYVYRTLHDLEIASLVTSHWELSERGGPERRVYRLTPEGEAALDRAAVAVGDLARGLQRFGAEYRALRGRMLGATSDPPRVEWGHSRARSTET